MCESSYIIAPYSKDEKISLKHPPSPKESIDITFIENDTVVFESM